MRAIILAVLVLLAATMACAAPPEVAQVRVTLDDRAQVDLLERNGFIVGNLFGSTATVYLLREDLPRLEKLGFAYEEIVEAPLDEKALDAYHNYAELTSALQGFASQYPNLTKLVSIGKSVRNRDIWALLITDNPNEAEDEPEFKYVSTMHGDEPIGTELLINLADLLLKNYGTNFRYTEIVNETQLWLVPCMNPDGLEAVTRYNANNIDLNRSFPTRQQTAGMLYDGAPFNIDNRQPEVRSVMTWSALHNFVLSANFHTGSLVVNYLYDDDGLPTGSYAACPDDELVYTLSLEYAQHNAPMSASTQFQDGVVNGTVWYLATGSMQDWNYRYLGCIEATIELNNVKKPAGSQLPTFWDNNRQSLLAYLEAVQWGLRGKITDRANGDPLYARIRVAGNDKPMNSDPEHGDYYRMLLAGTYDVTYEAPGYISYRANGVVVPDRDFTRLNVQLSNGDLNNDGDANAADVQEAVNALLQRPGARNADVDGLGLSATDLEAIIKKALE